MLRPLKYEPDLKRACFVAIFVFMLPLMQYNNELMYGLRNYQLVGKHSVIINSAILFPTVLAVNQMHWLEGYRAASAFRKETARLARAAGVDGIPTAGAVELLKYNEKRLLGSTVTLSAWLDWAIRKDTAR